MIIYFDVLRYDVLNTFGTNKVLQRCRHVTTGRRHYRSDLYTINITIM